MGGLYLYVAGLCKNKEDHAPHAVKEGSLAPFWCTANQADREPFRSERRRNGRPSN